jgi:hypothetical protein
VGGVESWLKELGLGERIGDFNGEAISVEALARMDDSQLQAMGVDRLSDRLTLVGRARDALGRERLESEIETAEARQHKLAGVPTVTEVHIPTSILPAGTNTRARCALTLDSRRRRLRFVASTAGGLGRERVIRYLEKKIALLVQRYIY